MGRGTFDVLRKQTAIEAHTFSELLNAAIGRHIKNTAPGLLRQIKPRTSNQDPDKIDNLLSLNDLRRIVNEAEGAEMGLAKLLVVPALAGPHDEIPA